MSFVFIVHLLRLFSFVHTASALKHVFKDINNALPTSGINAIFGGTTAVVALVRGPRMWVANAGDSRAMVAGRGPDGSILARALTWDQVKRVLQAAGKNCFNRCDVFVHFVCAYFVGALDEVTSRLW